MLSSIEASVLNLIMDSDAEKDEKLDDVLSAVKSVQKKIGQSEFSQMKALLFKLKMCCSQ